MRLVSSFGVGGTNACAILSTADQVNFVQQTKPIFGILPIAAKTQKSLEMMEEKIKSMKFDAYLAPSIAIYRRHYKHRSVFLSRNNELQKLEVKGMSKIQIVIGEKENVTSNLWTQIPYFKQFISTNNEKLTDIIVLIRFLKKIGFPRQAFDESSSTLCQCLDFVYTNKRNFNELLDGYEYFGLAFKFVESNHQKTIPIDSVECLEKMIAYAYIGNKYEIKWTNVYLGMNDNFLLEVVKKLPTYAFDEVVCWKSDRMWPVFDHQIFGNLIESNNDCFKFEGYLSEHRLRDLFKQQHFNVGFIVEGLAAIMQHLKPNSRLLVQKWQFNNKVHVRQMWVHTEVVIDTNNKWRFRFLTDGQIICKANGSLDVNPDLNFSENVDLNFNGNLIQFEEEPIFINSIERQNYHSTRAALMLNGLLTSSNSRSPNLKPIKINTNLQQLSRYQTSNAQLIVFNDQNELCAKFNAFDNAKEAKNSENLKAPKNSESLKEKHRIEDHKSDKLAEKIAQVLRSSVANNLDLNESYYDVGFFDLGIDSLAMIGFANQLLDAQLPRLTTNEMMTHSTINKLAAYIRHKTGLSSENCCDSGYSSVIERKLSNPIEKEDANTSIDISQLLYRVLTNQNGEEIRCKFRVTFIMKRNDILIFHKFGNKRSEITFNGLAKLITDSKPSKIELSFKMSSEQSDFNSLNVSKLFVRLGNLLINAEQTIEIHVHNLNNLISGMAMGFLKVRFIVLIHKS